MKIEKVPLKSLIALLTKIYEKGIDYVDIVGTKNSNKSYAMGISFTKEYAAKGDVVVSEETLSIKDLNDLV